MKILLIAGGWSNEREVSISGGRQIQTALLGLGHQVTWCDPLSDFDRLFALGRQHDFAFLNLHGAPGEDGLIQAILNRAGCPYQGSGPEPSFLALNKASAKQIFRAAGLATPDWVFLAEKPDQAWSFPLPFPAFVKPNTGGSSLGMSLVRSAKELPRALDAAFAASREVLIEPALSGPEVTCAVLGRQPLPPILIKPAASDFFDYQSKYTTDAAQEICPAPLPGHILTIIQNAAVKAHEVLGLTGYSRADFILSGETPWLLEVNTLPGMTPNSLLPKAAKAAGLDFPELIAKLIELGLAK